MQLLSPISLNLDIFANTVEIDLQSPTIPYSFEELSNVIGNDTETNHNVCQSVTRKNCKLINYSVLENEKSEILIICRELESGYYLAISIQPSIKQGECLASYIYLFSQQKQIGELEKIWHRLTRKASSDDWDILDKIIDAGSFNKIFLIGKEYFTVDTSIFPDVVRGLLPSYGISSYDESELPAFVVVDREEIRCLCTILNGADGFAKSTMVYDDFEDIFLEFNSLDLGFEAYCIDLSLSVYCEEDEDIDD